MKKTDDRPYDALIPMAEVTLGIEPDGSMALVQVVINTGTSARRT